MVLINGEPVVIEGRNASLMAVTVALVCQSAKARVPMRTSMGSKKTFLGHEKLKMLVVITDGEGDIKNQNPHRLTTMYLYLDTFISLRVRPNPKTTNRGV